MKCYKFISLLAVFFAVTTLTHAQNAGPCTGSEYATDAEFSVRMPLHRVVMQQLPRKKP